MTTAPIPDAADGFTPEDFAEIAILIRGYAKDGAERDLRAVMSNNINVILAALDRAQRSGNAVGEPQQHEAWAQRARNAGAEVKETPFGTVTTFRHLDELIAFALPTPPPGEVEKLREAEPVTLPPLRSLPSKYATPNFAVWLLVALNERYGIAVDLSVKQIRALVAEYDPSLTSPDDAPPTESILHPLADREKSADNLKENPNAR